MCENVTTNVFVQFPCSVSCLSFHLRRTCLSLQLVVCFCSVLHAVVPVHAQFTTLYAWLKIPRLCRPYKISPIAMSSMFALAHERSTLPRSFHQEQPLRSRCRSISTAVLRQKMPSYLHDAELSDETIGKALSSPLFSQEGEEPASRRQAYHSFEESLLSSQSLSVCHVSTERPINELSSLSSCGSREMENETREELQKRHVLKVKEFSRRKLTEDFLEVTSFFQGSNVKTVPQPYPDAEIDNEHTRSSLASPLYFQEREASASLLQVYHSQKRKLVSRCTVNFSKYGETRNAPSVQQASRCNRVFCWTMERHWKLDVTKSANLTKS